MVSVLLTSELMKLPILYYDMEFFPFVVDTFMVGLVLCFH